LLLYNKKAGRNEIKLKGFNPLIISEFNSILTKNVLYT
jgi:hypothetical protein